MAPIGKIYSYMPNPRVMRSLAAANLNGLTVELYPDFKFGVTNKTPYFLSKFPVGKVPAFEGSDGVTNIAESDAIALYIAESGPKAGQLVGRDPAERARIRQWILFADLEVFQNTLDLIRWRFNFGPYNAETEGKADKKLNNSLAVLEKWLEGRTWLVTQELSLADITLASALYLAFKHYVDKEAREKYPRVLEWYLRVIEQDGVKEVFGEPELIEVRQTPPS